MNRRDFTRRMSLALSGLGLLPGALRPQGRTSLRVNGARLNQTLDRLGQIGRNAATGGINRLAFSEADREARSYVADLMRAARLEVSIDAAANLIGRRPGRQASLPPLMFGSHIDSVPEGGNFDGPVGSLAAIEVAQTLADRGAATRHPLEVVIFANEENGKTGSRAMSGEVEARELDLITASGKTIRDGLAFLGGEPGNLDRARRPGGSVAGFLELHVEQGAVLDQAALPIGGVEGIVGIKRWNVTVEGFANHAGTTPMDARQDALLAAARFVDAVHRLTRERAGRQVATVGRIRAEPGAPNVIPGRAEMSLEIRDLEMSRIDLVFRTLSDAAREIGAATGTTFGFTQFYTSHAAPTVEPLRRVIESAARDLGLATMRLPSGAGHDAQSIALFAPIGMIFVPSVGGISHSPREHSRPEDITAGANVLLQAVLDLDGSV
ncbi:MAG TPA: Zn-dependent hydrolase [Gemmatimonadales bacterium]|nr:Zn-dependent hydrolase [Gemmatimonadales bacterium]